MKDYIEMTEDVLCRSKNIIKKKKRAVRAAVSSALCLCLVAVMGAGVWMTGVRRNDPQIPEETIAATEPAVTGDAVPTESKSESTQKPDTSAPEISSAPNDTIVLPSIDESRVLWANETSSEGSKGNAVAHPYCTWNGKLLKESFVKVLEGDDNRYKEYVRDGYYFPIAITVSDGGFNPANGASVYKFSGENKDKEAYISAFRNFENEVFDKLSKYLTQKGIVNQRVSFVETYENDGVYAGAYLIIYVTADDFATLEFNEVGIETEWYAKFDWATRSMRDGIFNYSRKANM